VRLVASSSGPIPPRTTAGSDDMMAAVGHPSAETCKVCRNALGNKLHQAKEMMFGLRDIFTYVECAACGSVALLDPPADLGRFYPSQYCSFRAKETGIRGLAKKLRVQAYFGHGFGLGSWIAQRYPRPDLAAMARLAIPKNHRILDVGCGEGKLLLELRALGYRSLTGVDPFIESDLDYGNGVRVRKCFLSDLANSVSSVWDLITFHHSFEHIPDQLETLQAAAQLLAASGTCVVRIPVIGYAWEKYGTNWVQLDPPRHFFLHTEKSMELLAQKAGLRVKSIDYDSNEFQFWGSELYCRGIALNAAGVPREFFNPAQFRGFKKKADELNAERRGDQAIFHLTIGA
jgi:SAM-dependent methyltransferase